MRDLTVSAGPLEATFLPELGLLGTSLRHRGDELLALPDGLDGYRAGAVTGLPLLAPWANRLSTWRYAVGDVVVDLEGLDLSTDEQGIPIHGTMTAQPGWEIVAAGESAFECRFDYAARPDLLASFPFPHELRVAVAAEPAALRVATTVAPTADRAVPIAFGYHPYFRLPGLDRDDLEVRFPARRHVELDDRGIPTGAAHAEEPEDEPLGARRFDDHYELVGERCLEVAGGGRRLAVEFGEGYRFAQVFTPVSGDTICLEPMTATVNALVDGGYDVVAPGASFTAVFTVRVDA